MAIWRYLVSRGIAADEIAVFTDTKELPEGAERVTSLSQLDPRYRHIIFNQSLQEGWDDPEAYVCYFDGATKSFIRAILSLTAGDVKQSCQQCSATAGGGG